MKTILTLDASASIRQMVKLTLMSAGYKVLEAVDASDGLAKADANDINMVVTDLNMPDMNGIAFIKALHQKAAYKGVPIVCLTNVSNGAVEQEAKAAGATGWITKPFRPDQLTAVAKKLLS